MNITIELCIFELSLKTKFQLELFNFEFLAQIYQKGYFRSKMGKKSIAIAFCIFELLWVPNFTLHNFEFWEQICPEGVFSVKNEKTEHLHSILYSRVSLVTKFYSKQFWILGPNLPKEGIFGRKRKKWTPPLNSAYLI